MRKGRGRTSRIRRKRCLNSNSRGVTESYKPEFVALKKWLKDRKFEDTNLIPARFPVCQGEPAVCSQLHQSCDLKWMSVLFWTLRSCLWLNIFFLKSTGRGLMSRTSLREGQMVISLPESCLLTTDTVMRSSLGAYLAKWQPPPSPLLALCTFLVSERHAGDRSLWKPYLDILPKAYTCPVCWEPQVVSLLPAPLRAGAEEQRARVQRLFTSSRDFFFSLQPLFAEAVEGIFSYRALRWAWCTVNTRAVYVKHRQRPGCSAEPDTCALAPYLDLLNHSPHAQVKAAFNEETRCYEIRTGSRRRKHEEVFICYGPHDSRRLLLEYGFVSTPNPHAGVSVTEDVLVRYLPSKDEQMNKKISILKDHDLIDTCWKKVLLGEVISNTNEKASLDIAQKICHCFTEETHAMLKKISDMKSEEGALINQLTLVETLWTEELQILQASAETLNDLQRAFR
ncbi:SET domain-containing protein 4 isoform X2 [Talpa occidentalis]|uniref:SET domain-containing protein 4 isoform X2 n=1 Tax=Talpa occidentalis TaxID=50954 RepID=UPI0023F943EE|nr:SET domain-containing protein 4 isoform X2 [Talpa occidentalis]